MNNITWKQVEKDLVTLAKQIPAGKYNKIIALARGGLIPAYYVSKLLNIRDVTSVGVTSYVNKKQENLKLESKIKKDKSKKILIVDDLADSGKTLALIMQYYPHASSATLYYKSTSKIIPTYYTKKVEGWIEFPWETIEK